MLGGHGAVGDAHDGVGTGGEYPQFFLPAIQLVREGEAHAGALADPVGLHGPDPLRPARQLVEVGQQRFGVLRDAEVIAGNFALLDHGAGAPAAPVDDLFVGQHGLVDRVPVHHLGFLVGNAFLQHAQKQPLVPPVVIRLAGGEFPAPVYPQPQRLQLLLHVGDVVVSPPGRRHPVLDGGILGRQPEGIPAHGLQHVVAAHLVPAGEHVANGVVAHVSHVQLAGRVGEHRQAVILGPALVRLRGKSVVIRPVLPGALFNLVGLVLRLHGSVCFRMNFKGGNYTLDTARMIHALSTAGSRSRDLHRTPPRRASPPAVGRSPALTYNRPRQ
ncbi:hypothetical protein GALL_541640 [mine drainage metagenome]|uniref:Uncharacterized protein n=1 Tax=mine drainage metagenome TaxID=410659 RepID=A0A1J5PL73_9ZZZZ